MKTFHMPLERSVKNKCLKIFDPQSMQQVLFPNTLRHLILREDPIISASVRQGQEHPHTSQRRTQA